jgi:hypothetical protein
MQKLHPGLRRETMKKQRLLVALAAAVAMLLSVSIAGALDTSPYLVGTWEDTTVIDVNSYDVLNPTTKTLDVYILMLSSDATTLVDCAKFPIAANASQRIYAFSTGTPPYGALKFFAFPQGSRKFDPNAVIGGFQRKGLMKTSYLFNTEANLKAVTINSYTIGEFTQIPWADCREPG